MKRILPFFLLLVLMCGCSNAAPQPTETSAPTEPPITVYYTPGSAIEQQTGGTIRLYTPNSEVNWIAPISGGVLLASGEKNTALTLLSGIDGTVAASAELPVALSQNGSWQATASGFAYYDPEANAVVYLSFQLTETARLQLPEEISGEPAISQDGSQVFYCQGQTVYAMETERKITRPVRTNTCKEQTLLGCYLDGAVIACSVVDMVGERSTLYISGENGELLHKDNGVQKVYSSSDAYFALRNDGVVEQYIYGNIVGTPAQLNISDKTAYGVLELDGILGQTETENGIELSFYNMKKTAAVTLPVECKLVMVAADSTTEGIWLLTEKGELLHWSVKASAVTDETNYSGTVYTAEAPDTEGLEQCQTRAEELGKETGVVIRIWEKALTSNETFNVTAEYQTAAIDKALSELEPMLRGFPENFLYKSVAGQIRICIVRDIAGEVTSAYHWHDGDPFIILSVGVDMEAAFMDAFSYILDIHVLGNSAYLDAWETLNPAGFSYGGDMTVMAYLEGDTQAFADRQGMQSLVDDRARIFYNAMLADNAEVFQSETMQAKLLLLCRGIRDAWRLEQKSETYPWEQYLNQSLAYQQ